MSGVLAALLAGGSSESMVVTVGTGLGSGYSVAGEFGSISPGTLRGKSITTVRSVGGTDLQIGIDDTANLPQSFFARLTIEDGSGAVRNYESADATFVAGGVGGENWNFGDGNNPVFTSSDDTELHRITFFL